MKDTNLNMLFQSQVANFAHLITTEPQTKVQFLETVKKTYDTEAGDARTAMFYQSIQHSEFETVRLNRVKDAILFNQ
jgi:hypothetical protein